MMAARAVPAFGVLLMAACCAAHAHAQAGAGQDDRVRRIRAEYQRIQAAPLRASTVAWTARDDCPPPAEGLVVFYAEKTGTGRPVKIRSQGRADSGEWVDEFFYQGGELFFIHQRNT